MQTLTALVPTTQYVMGQGVLPMPSITAEPTFATPTIPVPSPSPAQTLAPTQTHTSEQVPLQLPQNTNKTPSNTIVIPRTTTLSFPAVKKELPNQSDIATTQVIPESKTSKVDTLEKARLISIISNYNKQFELSMNESDLKQMTISQLELELELVQNKVQSGNMSGTMLKHTYNTVLGIIEKSGPYVDLQLDGLQQEAARSQEIQKCIQELGCIYSIGKLDPRYRLLALTGFSILGVDSKNRLAAKMNNPPDTIAPTINKTEPVLSVPKMETASNKTQAEQDAELLNKLNAFNL